MSNPELKIYDIMACNVYWDFENSPFPKETHKLLVALFPTPGVFAPDLVESIKGYGPNGYEFPLNVHEKYTTINKNGWLFTPAVQNYWWMYNIPKGFMQEGEYTIEITCKDGTKISKSRVQKEEPSARCVDFYVKNKDKIFNSHAPSKTKPLSGSLKNPQLSWTPMSGLGGPDEYYVTRVAECSNPLGFDGNNLTFFDNIYVQRLRTGDVNAGKNLSGVTVDAELKPDTNYGYFVEITDSNIGGEANICIFQQHQFFKTA